MTIFGRELTGQNACGVWKFSLYLGQDTRCYSYWGTSIGASMRSMEWCHFPMIRVTPNQDFNVIYIVDITSRCQLTRKWYKPCTASYNGSRIMMYRLVTLSRGGAPIGAGGWGGVMTPHFSRQRGTGGHNLGIIHISHIALITPLH